MPRPSSGVATAAWGSHPLGAMSDRKLNVLLLPPSKVFECQQEAVRLLPEESRVMDEMVRIATEGIAWRKYGTSYIVDELIGGPWD